MYHGDHLGQSSGGIVRDLHIIERRNGLGEDVRLFELKQF
jgi:hypothetical protein